MKPFSNDGIFLVLDGSRGQYLPQAFANDHKFMMTDREGIDGVSVWALQTLRDGPDNSEYWDAWNQVTDSAYVIDDDKNEWVFAIGDGGGDLFALCPALMSDDARRDFGLLDETE